MRSSERAKWDVRHQAGAVLSGLWRKMEPTRRGELNDTMIAAAARVESTAAWFAHVLGRFDVALESCYIDEAVHQVATPRIDAVIAGIRWSALREAVEENPALITMIAKDGPLSDELAPPVEDEGSVRPWVMPVPTGELLPVPSHRSIWTSQSSMAHGADARYGNVILFRREPLVDLLTGEVVRCPFISGNSIRHSWRALAVDHLYRTVGLTKRQVNPEIHHSITSGGVIDAGSEMSKVDPALREGLRNLFPAFELFGGIAEKQVCHGSIQVHDATLVCRENLSRLMDPSIYPAPAGLEALVQACADAVGEDARRSSRVAYAKALAEHLRPALSFMTLRQYTKHIDPDLPTSADARHALWDTEVVSAGAQWVHHFTVHPTASPLARSAVGMLMAAFHAYPYLAAANGKGHGLVSFTEYSGTIPSMDECVQHIEANKQLILDWLATGKVPAAMMPAAPAASQSSRKRKS